MTSYALKLRPGGIIPPAIELGVVLQRKPKPTATITTAPAEPAPEPLPVGVDSWYDSREAVIPWRAYNAETAPDVNNFENGKDGADQPFSLDDAVAYELDIVDLYEAATPGRSAWWMLRVPDDAPAGCLLTFDNFQSRAGGASGLDPEDPGVPDLFLNLITTDADIPGGAWPTPEFDFDDLYQVASDEDTVDPDSGKIYVSRIGPFELVPGKTYWLRCDLYSASATPDDDVIYRLRLSLSIPA